jgi:hypothetical protein
LAEQSTRISITVPSYAIEFDKRALKATLRRAGAEIAAVARSKIKGAARAGRTYYGPGGSAAKYRGGYAPGRYQASASGGAPASITGTLEKSIKVKPFADGQGVAIRDTAFYAKFLESGAKGGGGNHRKASNLTKKKRLKRSAYSRSRVLEPRHFLTTALAERSASIETRIQDAVETGLKFVRIKP